MQRWTMGLAVLIGFLAAPTAKAEPNETLSIRVLVVNQAKVPDLTLQEAEHQATRIFSGFGITLLWTNTKPGEPHYEAAVQMRIVVVPDSRTERNRRLAIAHSENMAAYAFYRRIVGLAEHNGADVAALAGHVIAHEIGHLLLPYDSHSSSGVMRGEWDRAQFDEMAKGLLAFGPEQAHLIRTRVATLRSSIVHRPSSMNPRTSTNPPARRAHIASARRAPTNLTNPTNRRPHEPDEPDEPDEPTNPRTNCLWQDPYRGEAFLRPGG